MIKEDIADIRNAILYYRIRGNEEDVKLLAQLGDKWLLTLICLDEDADRSRLDLQRDVNGLEYTVETLRDDNKKQEALIKSLKEEIDVYKQNTVKISHTEQLKKMRGPKPEKSRRYEAPNCASEGMFIEPSL